MKYWNWRHGDKLNFGDEITGLLLPKIFPNEKHELVGLEDADFVGVGSTLHNIRSDAYGCPIKSGAIVWGTGGGYFPKDVDGLDVRAVRGQLTRDRCGLPETTIIGDPAVLLPLYYPAQPKKYRLGVVRHMSDSVDYGYLNPDIVIDAYTDDALDVVNKITSCEFVVSSSLHGWIVALAYGIPSMPLPVGDGHKYVDFMTSLDAPISEIQNRLLRAITHVVK